MSFSVGKSVRTTEEKVTSGRSCSKPEQPEHAEKVKRCDDVPKGFSN